MNKKINPILNIIMGSFIGQFIGYGLYGYWHFRKYPDFYIVQSAPWYTSILMRGLFTLVILAICMIIKIIFMENIGIVKKITLILSVIFWVLTLIGGGYVLINHGQVNAGYAVVPGIWTMICFAYYRSGEHV